MKRGIALSWLQKNKCCLIQSRKVLDAAKLVGAVCCVNKACDLFIGSSGPEVHTSSSVSGSRAYS